MPRVPDLAPRKAGSNAQPFAAEVVRAGVLEPLSACSFTLRTRPPLGGTPTVVVGPVAGIVPSDGIALYLPSVGDVTQTPGSYEYEMVVTLATGETFVTPWIRHEITG